MTSPAEVLLLTPLTGAALDALVDVIGHGAKLQVASDRPALEAAAIGPDTLLLCFGSGVIVPAGVLRRLRRPAYNFHAASPDYPGRDPHHFAVHDGARTYGATAHVMTETVDAGPIVGVESFAVDEGCSPQALLARANAAALSLFRRLVPELLAGREPPVLAHQWGARKTRRRDFQAMCRLPLTIDRGAFERRFLACDGDSYDNLTTTLHGWTFRIDKTVPRRPVAADGAPELTEFTEFTEAAYAALLRLALASGYRFVGYRDGGAGRRVLWRHDIDASVHRAVRLAEMEAEAGVQATYFVNPHSDMYNSLEPAILARLRAIRTQGHAIGLHFDTGAYPDESWTAAGLEARMAAERRLLSTALDCPVDAVSFHNPDVAGLLVHDQDELAGMVNAYSRRLREGFVYASDSNGYWRHKPIPAVIREGHEQLHILTHPEWWTPEAMPPRARLERCVMGRAAAALSYYDEMLARYGRRNIGAEPADALASTEP